MSFINPHHLSALRSNLGIALYLLPSSLRRDALLFYHFCQQLDHFIDNSSHSLLEKEKLIDQLLLAFQEKKFSECSSFLLPASFIEMITRRTISCELLCELVHGMQMDLIKNRYDTFEELQLYAWRVASTVGLISAHLFEAKGKLVEKYATTLGIALQLTNILRDVAEDVKRRRIYLPQEDLIRFQVSEESFLIGKVSSNATQLFEYEAERILSFFAETETAWQNLTELQRRQLRPARLMESIYRQLLQKMSNDGLDLFHRRYRLTFFQKLCLIAKL